MQHSTIKNNKIQCNNFSSAVNGGWADWGAWGECSKTCAGGEQTKNRTCSNPAPAHGGNVCVGDNIVSQSCNTQECPRESFLHTNFDAKQVLSLLNIFERRTMLHIIRNHML